MMVIMESTASFPRATGELQLLLLRENLGFLRENLGFFRENLGFLRLWEAWVVLLQDLCPILQFSETSSVLTGRWWGEMLLG